MHNSKFFRKFDVSNLIGKLIISCNLMFIFMQLSDKVKYLNLSFLKFKR